MHAPDTQRNALDRVRIARLRAGKFGRALALVVFLAPGCAEDPTWDTASFPLIDGGAGDGGADDGGGCTLARVYLTADPPTICPGSGTNIRVSGYGYACRTPTVPRYEWKYGYDGIKWHDLAAPSPTADEIPVRPTATTFYQVRATFGGCGCTADARVLVEVLPPARVNAGELQAGPTFGICPGAIAGVRMRLPTPRPPAAATISFLYRVEGTEAWGVSAPNVWPAADGEWTEWIRGPLYETTTFAAEVRYCGEVSRSGSVTVPVRECPEDDAGDGGTDGEAGTGDDADPAAY